MSENSESSNMGLHRFCWNELLSNDVEASKQFYAGLFGWSTAAFTGGMDYTLFKSDGKDTGGMMKVPQPGMPAQWLPYVVVENVDASATKVTELGGNVMAPPFDIPTIGRIAVVIDPQGAAIGLITPQR
jgi:uncharacterized protein